VAQYGGVHRHPRLSIFVAPRASDAEQTAKVARLGYLQVGSYRCGPSGGISTEVFRQGLRELRYVEGQNIRVYPN
jgi:hypothetical protein